MLIYVVDRVGGNKDLFVIFLRHAFITHDWRYVIYTEYTYVVQINFFHNYDLVIFM